MKKAFCIWLTGLSGSGKSTIAKVLYEKLKQKEANLIYLDGDEFREIFGKDQKYDKISRIKVAQKKASLCKILNLQGINVICSGISLFEENYTFNRQNIPNYLEVYIYCSLDELKKRDQKGLYSTNAKEVVGIDIAFDEPNPHLKIDNTDKNKLHQKVDKIIDFISKANLV